MALLVYTCMKLPDARLKIVFVPHFDFSAKSAVTGMIAFDLICLLLGFKLFDHAAHLGGSLFGLYVCNIHKLLRVIMKIFIS